MSTPCFGKPHDVFLKVAAERTGETDSVGNILCGGYLKETGVFLFPLKRARNGADVVGSFRFCV